MRPVIFQLMHPAILKTMISLAQITEEQVRGRIGVEENIEEILTEGAEEINEERRGKIQGLHKGIITRTVEINLLRDENMIVTIHFRKDETIKTMSGHTSVLMSALMLPDLTIDLITNIVSNSKHSRPPRNQASVLRAS